MAEPSEEDAPNGEPAAQGPEELSMATEPGATDAKDEKKNSDAQDSIPIPERKVQTCGVCGQEPGKYKCSRCLMP